MSITQQHTQELLHKAYVLAVAADAGLNITLGGQLDYGVDATIKQVVVVTPSTGKSSRIEIGFPLYLQLKATTNWRVSATHVHYACAREDYNRLVFQNAQATSPVLLVVFCQPKARADWLAVSEEALTLRSACYWYNLTGQPTAKTSETIRIPRNQLFTASQLNDIMNRLNSGGTA